MTDGWPSITTLWTDERGVIWKTSDPFLNRQTFRVDKVKALASNDFLSTDMGIDTGISVKSDFPRPADTIAATYRVRLRDVSPQLVFPASLGQSIKVADDGTVLVSVHSVLPDQPPALTSSQRQPTDADRQPNSLINCDHLQIRSLAEAIVGTLDDPWRAAKLAESYLHRSLKKDALSQVFDSASTAAQKNSGDCSEHAVLLAAVCRALDIPARVVLGLIYSEPDRRFLFHMWNEVWIKDRWVPLDATVGKGWVAADHIKFRDSSLSGHSAFGVVASVAGIVGRLSIDVESVEHAE
jgi:transglutaminase-like putative cysteine protease